MAIYRFSKEVCDWTSKDQHESKMILGGKGAGLVMMAQNGFPVPPGFTIPTTACNELAARTDKADWDWYFNKLIDEAFDHDAWLGQQFGYMPLVSVRSGAPVSMPGMMDTILNVGITDDTLADWKDRLGKRTALDSYRRLIQMLGGTAFGVPHSAFEANMTAARKADGVETDAEISAATLAEVVKQHKLTFQAATQQEFPQTRLDQLSYAIKAVFDSWQNPRAIEYRKINKIDPAMGTAVNVQAMVFGNMDDDSGTGVLFTRHPSTGEGGMYGEFLQNAQGEDVVAGIRTPHDIYKASTMDGTVWPDIYEELVAACVKLEAAYDDMVDIEFTVQQGKLFILQSRVGKRSARAAFKIAYDLVDEEVIDKATALKRLTKEQFKVVRRPSIDPAFKVEPDLIGLPACPGVVTGKPVFSSTDAVNCTEPCILITHETTPDDIAGMNAAVGILTQTGGATSHAAVVARAMDKACVVGCTDMELQGKLIGKAGKCFGSQDKVTIDGATGRVWIGIDVPVIDSSDATEIKAIMEWAMEAKDVIETFPVFQGKDARPHAVSAAHWWGSIEVARAVLNQLAPNWNQVLLDLRSPALLTPSVDSDLTDCFGDLEVDKFEKALVAEVVARKQKLKACAVMGSAYVTQQLVAHGFGVASGPVVASADYAAFSVLGQ